MRPAVVLLHPAKRPHRIPVHHPLTKAQPVSNFEFVARPAARPFRRTLFSGAEWSRLALLYGFIGLLHVVGWGTYLHYAVGHPSSSGWASSPTCLDCAMPSMRTTSQRSTTRFGSCCRKGASRWGRVLFFVGHSTVVVVLAVGVAFAATAVKTALPQLQTLGSIIGAGVSGTFLWIIGVLNLLVLLDILKVWEKANRDPTVMPISRRCCKSGGCSIDCSAVACKGS